MRKKSSTHITVKSFDYTVHLAKTLNECYSIYNSFYKASYSDCLIQKQKAIHWMLSVISTWKVDNANSLMNRHCEIFFTCSLLLIKATCITFWIDSEGHFLKCYTPAFSQIFFFLSPRTSSPAVKTCQAGASLSKRVRGHQLESHPRPREPAAQLATGSGMSDFLHGVTAVCWEVTASSQYKPPFSVWWGRPHLNSKEPSQCHQ